MLAGTLTLPDEAAHGPGPYPAAVLVSGSGPQDRDETLFGHKPFAVLADALTRAGVAVLRYDDRGYGEGTGDHAAATTRDFAADALGAARFLSARNDVRAVGVIGHSEGGLIAPLLASENPDEVAFAVLLAGPAVRGDDVLRAQSAAMMRAAGQDDAAVAKNRAVQDALFDAVSEAADDADLDAKLAAVAEAMLRDVPAADREAARPNVEAQTRRMAAPWMRAFVALDPAPALRKLRRPTLAAFGGRDLQVTAEANVLPMTRALAGNPAAAVVVFPNLNHLFQPAETGLPGEYGTIETTLDPRLLGTVTAWVTRAAAADL